MKKIVLILTLFFTELCYGQEAYMPILKDGRSWYYLRYNLAFQRKMRHVVNGDTIINSKTWKKVYIEDPLGTNLRFEKPMREEGGRVYEGILRDGQMIREDLFMDFTVSIGDTIRFGIGNEMQYYYHYLVVDSIGSIESKGKQHKAIYLTQHYVNIDIDNQQEYDIADEFPVVWAEGIGSPDCGINLSCDWYGLVGVTTSLRACFDGNACIYGNEDFVSGISAPTTDDSHFPTPAFDLQGRRVANPQKGIYIRNGKKVVVK